MISLRSKKIIQHIGNVLFSIYIIILLLNFGSFIGLQFTEPDPNIPGLAIRYRIFDAHLLSPFLDQLLLSTISVFFYLLVLIKLRSNFVILALNLVLILSLALAIGIYSLSGFGIVAFFLILYKSRRLGFESPYHYIKSLLIWLFIFTLVIQALSLSAWIGRAFLGDLGFLSQPIDLQWQMMNLFQPLLLFLVAMSLFFWIPLNLLDRKESEKAPLIQTNDGEKRSWFRQETYRNKILFLILVSLAITLSIFPYLPSINPTEKLVGVDVIAYSSWIEKMGNLSGIDEKIGFAVGNGRTLTILLLYAIQSIGSFWMAWVIYSIVASVLLSLTTFWLVRRTTGSFKLGCLGGVFTSVSPQFSASFGGGFYANWLALSFMILLFGFILKPPKNPFARFTSLFVLSALLNLAQEYTWVATLAITIILIGLEMISRRKDLSLVSHALSIIAIIAGGLLVILLRSLISYTMPLAGSIKVVSMFTLSNLLFYASNLDFVIKIYIGGAFAQIHRTSLSFPIQKKGCSNNPLFCFCHLLLHCQLVCQLCYD
ncbi:MAG: hypothetical protein H3Z54_13860 [archaeon]|nr:hypothetical protein [archaeon]